MATDGSGIVGTQRERYTAHPIAKRVRTHNKPTTSVHTGPGTLPSLSHYRPQTPQQVSTTSVVAWIPTQGTSPLTSLARECYVRAYAGVIDEADATTTPLPPRYLPDTVAIDLSRHHAEKWKASLWMTRQIITWTGVFILSLALAAETGHVPSPLNLLCASKT